MLPNRRCWGSDTLLFPQTGTKNYALWSTPHERKYLFLKVVSKWLSVNDFTLTITQYIAEKWKLLSWHWHEMPWFLQTKAFLWSPGTVSSHILTEHLSSELLQFHSQVENHSQKIFNLANHRYRLLTMVSLIPRFFGFNTPSQMSTEEPKSMICCWEAFRTAKPSYHSSPSRLQFFSLINVWVREQFGGEMLLIQAKISRRDQT